MTAIEKLIDQLYSEEIVQFFKDTIYDPEGKYPESRIHFDLDEDDTSIFLEFYPNDEYYSEGEFIKNDFLGYVSTLCWHLFVSKDYDKIREEIKSIPSYGDELVLITINYMPIFNALLGEDFHF
jgi:hypothetical protein